MVKAPAKNRRKGPARVLLVDDHPVVRKGVTQVIQRERDLTVCGEASTAHEALKAISDLKPDAAVVDLSLSDGSGLELTKDIKVRHPALAVLILSMHDEAIYAERALRAGARGYLMKDKGPEDVVAALRRILAGEIYLGDKVAQNLLAKIARGDPATAASQVDCLSDRELEVFRLLGEGIGTREVAARLHRSVKTVEAHRENIKRKLNLRDAADLLKHAIQWAQGEKA